MSGKCTVVFSGTPGTSDASGTCQLTHLGNSQLAFHATSTSGFTGTVVLTAADGDRLLANIASTTATFVGGTGRFSSATGSAQVTIGTDKKQGTTLTWSGTIAFDASDRRNGAQLPVTLDPTHAATARIGAAGGSVSTVSPTGVHYTLTFPAGSLINDVDITITPVTSMPSAQLDGGFVGGVDMQPSGLTFAKPAELHISLSSGSPAGMVLIGLVFEGNGVTPGLAPALNRGTEAVILVPHFSGAAAGFGTSANLAQIGIGGPATSAGQAFINQLIGTPNIGQAAILQIAKDWLNQVIRPMFQNALTDIQLLRALGELNWWRIEGTYNMGVNFQAALPVDYAIVQDLERLRILDAVNGNADLCGSQQSLVPLENVVFWHDRAIDEQVDLPQYSLDVAGVNASIAQRCLSIVFVSTNLPNPLTVGSPYFSDFTWGLQFVGGAQPQPATFNVNSMSPASGSQVTISPAHGRTNFLATFQSEITPDASGAIGINVTVCLVLPHPFACDPHGLVTFSHQISRTAQGSSQPPGPPPQPPPQNDVQLFGYYDGTSTLSWSGFDYRGIETSGTKSGRERWRYDVPGALTNPLSPHDYTGRAIVEPGWGATTVCVFPVPFDPDFCAARNNQQFPRPIIVDATHNAFSLAPDIIALPSNFITGTAANGTLTFTITWAGGCPYLGDPNSISSAGGFCTLAFSGTFRSFSFPLTPP